MFTGIVESTGCVLALKKLGKGARLSIKISSTIKLLKLGESIAVNGCCVTVVSKSPQPPFVKGGRGGNFEADLSEETLRVTNLGHLKVGDTINLESPLKLGDRLGGHLVQGHVDGLGKIMKIRPSKDSTEITLSFPASLKRYLIPKGSVTVDGISMTIHHLTPKSFSLYVIPHTLKVTNLKAKRVGECVNLEVDSLGKYVEKMLTQYGHS